MKTINRFESEPDYCFANDEYDTILVWPDTENEGAFVCKELDVYSGEVLKYRIWNYEIPKTWEEYDYIMTQIRSSGGYEFEML